MRLSLKLLSTLQACMILAVLGLVPVAAWAAAASVQFATGDVLAESTDGTKRPLLKGTVVNAGDTIQTQTGRVQLRFTDGGYVSLQPNTQFKVDDYAYDRANAGSGKNFFTLVKGGMRAITGLVGKANKEAYRVNTPVATIGIRGTEYLAEFEDKLLVKVGDGAVFITNLGGDIILYSGQVGEVTGSSTKPQYSTEEPSVNAAAPTGAAPDEVQTQAENENNNASVFSTGELSTAEGDPCVVEGGCGAATSLGLVPSNPTAAGQFIGFLLGATYDDTSNTSLAEVTLGGVEINVDAAGNLISGKDMVDNKTFTYVGQTVDKGSIGGGGLGAFNPTANLGLSWARLTGGTFTFTDAQGLVTTELISNEHVIFGGITDSADAVFSGASATYSYAGGTSPTDAAGNLGSVTSGSLSVNFVAATFNLNMGLNLNTGPGAGAYTVAGSGLVTAPVLIVDTSSVTGTGCSGACGLEATGFFSGTSAIRAALSYVLFGSAASGDIAGVAAFTKN